MGESKNSTVQKVDLLRTSFMSDLMLVQGLCTIHYSVVYSIELGNSLGLDTQQ